MAPHELDLPRLRGPVARRGHRVAVVCPQGDVPAVGTGAHRAYQEQCRAVADPDDGVEPHDTVHPETLELLEELTSRTPRRSSA